MMMDVNACVFREVESDGNFLNDVAHDLPPSWPS